MEEVLVSGDKKHREIALERKMPTEEAQMKKKQKVPIPLLDEDCERPSCDDVKKALPASMEELQAMAKKQKEKQKVECPPNSAELGRSSWKLLHSMVRTNN